MAKNGSVKQLYAIVDLETTGGRPEFDRVMEVGVVITDGQRIIETYETLVNPGREIPPFIQGMTGIYPDMVAEAPSFDEVAEVLFEMLQGKIFIAHNVNFDYHFLRHHFHLLNFPFNAKRLCTVRYARKVVPGLPSYSLGKLCKNLDIVVNGRHRALGDATATAELFHLLYSTDSDDHLSNLLKGNNKELNLPPNVSLENYLQLPELPGVYYFLDEHSKPLYVGKAKDIKKRVNSHLHKDLKHKDMKGLFERIDRIEHEVTGSELIAYLLESHEIKRLQPPFNVAQLRRNLVYYLSNYIDQNGYQRLALQRGVPPDNALGVFRSLPQARSMLYRFVKEHQLCERLSGLLPVQHACGSSQCLGACEGKEPPKWYNQRLLDALDFFQHKEHCLLIVGKGRHPEEKSVVCLEYGKLLGYGYIEDMEAPTDPDTIKPFLTPMPESSEVQQIIQRHLQTLHPQEVHIRY